ncbi:MAG: acyl-CoA dehydrogenase [Azospirillaceae bacterium]|nr:acyl-CoA dehydrogenase [Azospirillaceae bacterium]
MDFSYTENQVLLRDSVDRFLTDRYDLRARDILIRDPAGQQRFWRELADLGLVGAALPEAAGGFAESPVDTLVVMDRLGRHLVAEPYVITAVVCGRLLLDSLPGAQARDALAPVIAGERQLALMTCGNQPLYGPAFGTLTARRSGGGYVLDGHMAVVINGDRADQFLVAARTAGADGERPGVTLFLVDAGAAGLGRHPFRMIDGHGAAAVTLAGVVVGAEAVIGPVDGAVPLIERALDHGIAATCAEATGSAAYLLDTTIAYTNAREQYGQPLARFQVLQHRMADMYIAVETARSMACFAALSLDQVDVARARDLSAAKAQVSRATRFVGQYAVQLHGGMGVSEELDVGHHYIRLVGPGPPVRGRGTPSAPICRRLGSH